MSKSRFFVIALAIVMGGVAFSACNSDVEESNSNRGESDYDELYYAQNATISCSDSAFTGKDEEGEIHLAVSGGEVRIDVDCGTEWIVYNDNSDVFGTDATSNSLTVSAGQNLVKSERTGTIYLMTRWYRIIFATITVTQDAYGAPEITSDTKEWHVPAVGVLSTEIAVDANGEWTAESNAEWLTIAKTENAITLTVAQNQETTERTAEVVLTCADGYNSASQKIKVTQDALAYITLGAEELTVYAYEYTTTVKVESNFDWDCTCNSDWLTVKRDDNYLAVTYTTNESTSDREAVLAVIAGDGAENVTETELKVTQKWYDPEKSLILEYTISSNGKEIALPLSSVASTNINWGDGEFETAVSDYPSHTYSTAGTYTVAINGDVGHIQSYESSSSISGTDCLTAVTQWGDLGLTDMSYSFYGCTNLLSLPEGVGTFSNVTSCSHCFSNCTSLTELPEELFQNCFVATDFSYAFCGCTSLKTIPENIFSNCTAATNFSSVFSKCSRLTSAPSFEGCSAVTSFFGSFDSCSALTTVPENIFSGCTVATDFCGTFRECSALINVPENIFSDCVAATTFGYCFYNCTKLVSAPSFENCVAVIYFYDLFEGCSSLKYVPVSIFDGCTLVTDFRFTFSNCTALEGESPYTEINVNGEVVKVHLYERENYPDYFTKPTLYKRCFYWCTRLTDYSSIPSGWKSY